MRAATEAAKWKREGYGWGPGTEALSSGKCDKSAPVLTSPSASRSEVF
jgi:hypothetical protein